MIKAILLDRDGTVIREKPGVYISKPREVKLYKNTLNALKLLKKMGYALFIVSNQSGIGRGYFTAEEVEAVNAHIVKLLKPAADIKAVYYCPHAPGTPCTCRKPAPKMGLEIIEKYNVDASKSYVIGDKKSDIDFGNILGMKSILVLTANGRAQKAKYGSNIHAVKTAADIYAAAKYIQGEN